MNRCNYVMWLEDTVGGRAADQRLRQPSFLHLAMNAQSPMAIPTAPSNQASLAAKMKDLTSRKISKYMAHNS